MITPEQVLSGCYFKDEYGSISLVADVFPTDDGEYVLFLVLPTVPYDEVVEDENSVVEFCELHTERVWPTWGPGDYSKQETALPTVTVKDEDRERENEDL